MLSTFASVAKDFAMVSIGFGLGLLVGFELLAGRVKSTTRFRLKDGAYDITAQGRLTVEPVDE